MVDAEILVLSRRSCLRIPLSISVFHRGLKLIWRVAVSSVIDFLFVPRYGDIECFVIDVASHLASFHLWSNRGKYLVSRKSQPTSPQRRAHCGKFYQFALANQGKNSAKRTRYTTFLWR